MSHTSSEDRRLRELFARLHHDDEVPAFLRLWRSTGSARQPRLRRIAAVAVPLLAVLAVGVLYLTRPGSQDQTVSRPEELTLASSLSEWQAPLDFLLDTPGYEYLSSTPAIELSFPPSPLAPFSEEEVLR